MNWYRHNKCLDVLNAVIRNGDPDQPRDADGRWIVSGGPLKPEEAAAIRHYTSGTVFVDKVHSTLRAMTGQEDSTVAGMHGMSFGNQDKQKDLDYVRHMDQVIDRHTLGQDTTLYRGITADLHKEIKRLKPGQVLADKSYTSTSTDEKVAQSFKGGAKNAPGGAVIVIRAPAGSRALPATEKSLYKDQAEVILPRRKKLVYAGVVGKHHTFDMIDHANPQYTGATAET